MTRFNRSPLGIDKWTESQRRGLVRRVNNLESERRASSYTWIPAAQQYQGLVIYEKQGPITVIGGARRWGSKDDMNGQGLYGNAGTCVYPWRRRQRGFNGRLSK